jgi:transposase
LAATTWLACLSVVTDDGADLAALAADGLDAFSTAARARLCRFGAARLYHRIVRAFFAALTDPAGVATQRPGALERAGLVLADWRHTRTRLAEVESRMVGVLDAMGLTALVTSIPGLSALGTAVILAETGDLSRFASARSVVKHAGLNPAENTSATFRGQTRLSRRGRPRLRLAAWRAVWGALPHNPVLHAKFTHLTRRDTDRLAPAQARAACAATLLRWLHAIVTRRQPFHPDIAAGLRRAAGRHTPAVAA